MSIGREISLDTETTGLDPAEGHRIVEIGCVEMINRVRTGNTYHTYVNPQRGMPEVAYSIHGLSEEFLSDKPLFPEIKDEFLEYIGDSKLVIHNAKFDMKFLNAELFKINGDFQLEMQRSIDTLLIARKMFPGSPASLDALCKRFNIDNSHRTKHGALLDAELLADMYLELMGGSQETLDLAKDQKKSIDPGLTVRTEALEPRLHEATAEELGVHKEFVESVVKNSLWKKCS